MVHVDPPVGTIDCPPPILTDDVTPTVGLPNPGPGPITSLNSPDVEEDDQCGH